MKLASDRQRWTVRGVTRGGRFAILTKPFNPQRTVLYTVIDFDRGVRGKDDHYGLGYESAGDIESALHHFQHTEDDQRDCDAEWCIGGVNVSFRSANHVRLDFVSVNGEPTDWAGHPVRGNV